MASWGNSLITYSKSIAERNNATEPRYTTETSRMVRSGGVRYVYVYVSVVTVQRNVCQPTNHVAG
jgi:hypothetical protein